MLPCAPSIMLTLSLCFLLCCAVLCCAVLCCAVLCCAVLCCAVLCCAVVQHARDCARQAVQDDAHALHAALQPRGWGPLIVPRIAPADTAAGWETQVLAVRQRQQQQQQSRCSWNQVTVLLHCCSAVGRWLCGRGGVWVLGVWSVLCLLQQHRTAALRLLCLAARYHSAVAMPLSMCSSTAVQLYAF
jgi:hypothetical protein